MNELEGGQDEREVKEVRKEYRRDHEQQESGENSPATHPDALHYPYDERRARNRQPSVSNCGCDIVQEDILIRE